MNWSYAIAAVVICGVASIMLAWIDSIIGNMEEEKWQYPWHSPMAQNLDKYIDRWTQAQDVVLFLSVIACIMFVITAVIS